MKIQMNTNLIYILLGAKKNENILPKLKEMVGFQKNTHKFLNSIADLMGNLVPNTNKPTLKEMWSFLKFTLRNYQEIKLKYENSTDELEVYGKIKQMLNADLKEEIIYNLNSIMSEKKIFSQIINKIKKIFNLNDGLSLTDINQELNRYK